MQRIKQLVLLVLALFLLLPSAAWAVGVPEVTEEEYRFFLEYYASEYLDAGTDFKQYTDKELKELLVKAVEKEQSYTELLKYEVWYHDALESGDTKKYSDIELEKFLASTLADKYSAEYIKDVYQIEFAAGISPQEIAALRYQEKLKEEYNILGDFSELEWYELEDLYDKYSLIDHLQNSYYDVVPEDLSSYTMKELTELERQLYVDEITKEFDIKEDLSGYSLEELYDIRWWYDITNSLRDEYGVTEDLTNYANKELQEMYNRFSIEKKLFEYGCTEDLSQYTMEELEAMDWKFWEKERKEERTRIKVYIYGIDLLDFDEITQQNIDTRPIMQDNRVYIPFRAVFEALGADVSYNASAKTVTAKRDSTTVSFTVGEAQYSKNGVTQQMDANVFVQDGRTFVPVRFAAQALGATVEWDSENRTVVITE